MVLLLTRDVHASSMCLTFDIGSPDERILPKVLQRLHAAGLEDCSHLRVALGPKLLQPHMTTALLGVSGGTLELHVCEPGLLGGRPPSAKVSCCQRQGRASLSQWGSGTGGLACP